MQFDPKIAWEKVKQLSGGESSHHATQTTMSMRPPNGNLATNDEDKTQVFGPHFERVYNNHRPTYLEVVQRI